LAIFQQREDISSEEQKSVRQKRAQTERNTFSQQKQQHTTPTHSPLSPTPHHIHQQKHTHIAKADRRKKEPLVCYVAVGVVVVILFVVVVI
jgi:hypothetical protein